MIDFVRPKVICEKADRSDIPDIDKKKYLVPADLSTGEPGTLCHLAIYLRRLTTLRTYNAAVL